MNRAFRDIHAAELLIAGDAHAEALFHCQQAVEKALKAFLTFHQHPFRKTHDLGDLSSACFAIDGSLQSVAAGAEDLTQYAWRFRYPGEFYEPNLGEAAAGLQKAQAVAAAIEVRLGVLE